MKWRIVFFLYRGLCLLQVCIFQHCSVTMVNMQYKRQVDGIESKDGCPITPGYSFSKVYYLVPLASNNKDKHGIALDGYIKVNLGYQVRPIFLYSKISDIKIRTTISGPIFSCLLVLLVFVNFY